MKMYIVTLSERVLSIMLCCDGIYILFNQFYKKNSINSVKFQFSVYISGRRSKFLQRNWYNDYNPLSLHLLSPTPLVLVSNHFSYAYHKKAIQ